MNDSQNHTHPRTAILSNRVYDTLKWVAQVLLPALGALYFGLGDIWDLPKVTEVVGTLAVIDTFLGLLLGVSTKQYMNSDERFDGRINVVKTEHEKRFDLELDTDPNELDQKDEVLFKVDSDEPTA